MSTIQEEEELIEKPYDWGLFKRFLGYMHPHRPVVLILVLVMLAGITIDLAAPFLIRMAIDGPVAAKDVDGLKRLAGFFFILVLLSGTLKAAQHYISNLAGQRILFDLRIQVFARLQHLPISYYDKTPVGRLLTRVTGDVENLAELFTSGLVGMLGNLLSLVLIVIAMIIIDPTMTLLTMAVMPLAILMTIQFRLHARKTYRAARRSIAAVTAYLNECLSGIKTIQAFNRQESCMQRFDEGAALYRTRSIHAGYIYSFFWPGIELITTMAVALVLWQGGNGILAKTTTFGSFIAFWYLVRKFFEPIQELAEKYNILQAAMASAERIFEILDAPTSPAPEKPDAPPEARGAIEFQNVSFSYDGNTPVLKNVSFTVKPGETVALVGYTGAGKTSVLSLLLRLYELQEGRILVDGVDVRDWDPRTLRKRFGMVFQDVFLFSGTVEENVRLGRTLTREHLDSAAKLVNADRVLNRLPERWSHQLQERGASISSGERQLLSFARALAGEPSVLILDEATANIDAETEGLIQDALERILVERTSIVVAHRLSTVRKADKILMFHKGELREEGSHEELVAQQGLYEKLHRLQFPNGKN
ncbi:MAG: antibiotic ABC transporter ATP-binding protein [Elusimicrobia bacterium]|nr:MAG: antibiotic ABC transporter ATP-binding protein [Elusimicrobiota bacterium]